MSTIRFPTYCDRCGRNCTARVNWPLDAYEFVCPHCGPIRAIKQRDMKLTWTEADVLYKMLREPVIA